MILQCQERVNWPVKRWLRADLSRSDFEELLICYNQAKNGWQLLTEDHTCDIGCIAKSLLTYSGTDAILHDAKAKVLDYERRIQREGPFKFYCLVRKGINGKCTLFGTNKRSLSVYTHYFIYHPVKEFPRLEAIIAEVQNKLSFMSE